MIDAVRTLDFLDGTAVVVPDDTCRGCYMNANEPLLPSIMDPIWDDGLVTVRQDAEWPVPGFMVVGIRPHIGSLADMSLAMAHRITTAMHVVRTGMKQALGIDTVQTYQEEKVRLAHYHVWMLPLWPDVMAAHAINPRIYESNIARYLSLFDYRTARAPIQHCNERLRNFVRSSVGFPKTDHPSTEVAR